MQFVKIASIAIGGLVAVATLPAEAMPVGHAPVVATARQGGPVQQVQFGYGYGYGYRRPFYGRGYGYGYRRFGYGHGPYGYGYHRRFGYGPYGYHRRFYNYGY